MAKYCDVAVIGAGPYGLSVAAHLKARGIDFRIFGKALDTWLRHMPHTMSLKSDGFACSLSSPEKGSRLEDFCGEHGLPFEEEGMPVPLDTFVAYAKSFRERFVPAQEETLVSSLTRKSNGLFSLTLDNGETCEAAHVILAVGITSFRNIPGELSALPKWALSHSFDHRDGSKLAGRDVAVIGGGASAVDTAALLHDAGANVIIVARDKALRFHSAPDSDRRNLLTQIQRPSSGIGPGWRSYLCVHAPLLFHRMPEAFRLRVVKRHLGPAPCWFMRDRIEGRVPKLLGAQIACAETVGDKVHLKVTDSSGDIQTIICDHVVCGTGYRPDLRKLPFMDETLRNAINHVQHTPTLSDSFETSVPGLYAVGPLAANAFGPLLRFMVGAEFAAPRVAKYLSRRLGEMLTQRAA